MSSNANSLVSVKTVAAVPAVLPAQSPYTDTASDGELVRLWLAGKAPSTKLNYQRVADSFRCLLLGRDRELRTARVEDVIDWHEAQTVAETTASVRLATVKSLLSFGCRLGYLPFNVGAIVTAGARADRLSERLLSESEVQRIFAHTRKPRDLALFKTLYYTGARVSEVVRLRWGDVLERPEGLCSIRLQTTKTRAAFKPERFVLCPAPVTEALDTLPRGTREDFVFPGRHGSQLSTRAIHSVTRRAADRAELDRPVSPHWFRHAHATHALERGAPIHLVSATLGHASPNTTGKYLHARPTASSATYLPT